MSRVSVMLGSTPGRLVVIALRLVLAAVFLGAAIPKLQDPAQFARDIDNYRMLPDLLIGPLAIGLPAAEVVLAAALIVGVHARGAALACVAMLIAFAVGMVQAIARGIDLDCGCFGHVVEAQVSWWTVGRNVVLAIGGALIVLSPHVAWRSLGRGRASAV